MISPFFARRRFDPVLPFRALFGAALASTLLWVPTGQVRAADCTFRYQVTGSIPNQAFGTAVATIGDVNGDGIPDFAVGAPGMPGTATSPDPAVYVFSGRDGSPIYQQPGPINSGFGSAIAALGDVNGDGVPDFLVGAPESVGPGGGCVFALSGRDGSTIYTLPPHPNISQFGASVASGADFNGDGIDDFAVGAPGSDTLAGPGSGAVFAFSGRDGHLLYERDGEAAGDQFGASVALFRVGSQQPPSPNAPALLVGAPGADVVIITGFVDNAGAAYEFAASTGMLIRKLIGEAAADHFGASVAGLGDVDGDGFNDLVVGAPNSLIAPGQRGGHVYVFSGATGSEIFVHHTAIQGDAFGAAVSGIGDVTGDTVSDVLVGASGDPAAPSALPGSVTVLSGGSGLELCRTDGFVGNVEHFGIAVAPLGDLNGDGFPEWIAGAPGFSVGPVAAIGAVRVYGVAPGPPPGHPSFIEIDDNRFPFTINLKWGAVPPTCAGTDYALVVGFTDRMGQGLTNHLPYTCSTGGATEIALPEPAFFPPGRALYFIVTAQTPNEEGSYGQGTLGNEHPPSSKPCKVFLNTSTCFVP